MKRSERTQKTINVRFRRKNSKKVWQWLRNQSNLHRSMSAIIFFTIAKYGYIDIGEHLAEIAAKKPDVIVKEVKPNGTHVTRTEHVENQDTKESKKDSVPKPKDQRITKSAPKDKSFQSESKKKKKRLEELGF